MRRGGTDDAKALSPIARPKHDAVAGNDPFVPPTERREAHVALVVDPFDDEADLVHVGIEHQHPIVLPFPHGDEVAQRIDRYAVDERRNARAKDLTDLVLESRDSERVRKFAQ